MKDKKWIMKKWLIWRKTNNRKKWKKRMKRD